MPQYRLTVKDPKRVHEKEIERNIARNRQAFPHALPQVVEAAVRAHFKERPAGSVYSITSPDCPDGLPNCRNCGDPAFADSCKAAGHCPNCGTAHGMIPESAVAAWGYEPELIED